MSDGLGNGKELVLDIEKVRASLIPDADLDLGDFIKFYPKTGGFDFLLVHAPLARNAFEELVRIAHLAATGIGKPTARDKLLYQMFREHARMLEAVEETEETEETETGD